MSQVPPNEPPDRRTALGAVLLVLALLGGLAVWVATGDPAPPPGPSRAGPLPTAEGLASPEPVDGPGDTAGEAVTGADRPDGGDEVTAPGRVAGDSLRDVDWAAVDYPVDCAGLGVEVTDVVLGELTGDGRAGAVVAVRCAAGAGSPPSALFAFTEPGAPDQAPDLLAELLGTGEDVLLQEVSVERGRVEATGFAYSGPDVPRCCPDETVRAVWDWTGQSFARRS